MKYLKLPILIAMVIVMASCKKAYIFTQADLIGTWTETQPYLFNDGHFILQFNSNDTVIEHGFPDTCISAYLVKGNDYLQLNTCLAIPGEPGSTTYQISGDANDLTVINFVQTGSGPLVWQNLYLKKN